MEGYYWRIVAAETVIVVLCGVGRGADGRWGLVALASHPGTHVRHVAAAPAVASPTRFGVRAGEVLDGSLERLRLRLGDEDWLELRLSACLTWPRGAFGADRRLRRGRAQHAVAHGDAGALGAEIES